MTAKAQPAEVPTAAQLYEQAADDAFERWLEESFSRQALKGVELFEHKVPSGIVFKVRNLTPEFLVQSGGVPVGEISDAVLEDENVGELTPAQRQERFEALSPQEKLQTYKQVARQMRYICVEPRLIVGEVNGHKNAISVAQLRGPDFNSLAVRSNPVRGAEVSGLRTFRRTKKRR